MCLSLWWALICTVQRVCCYFVGEWQLQDDVGLLESWTTFAPNIQCPCQRSWCYAHYRCQRSMSTFVYTFIGTACYKIRLTICLFLLLSSMFLYVVMGHPPLAVVTGFWFKKGSHRGWTFGMCLEINCQQILKPWWKTILFDTKHIKWLTLFCILKYIIIFTLCHSVSEKMSSLKSHPFYMCVNIIVRNIH